MTFWVVLVIVIMVVIAVSSSSRKGRKEETKRSPTPPVRTTVTSQTAPAVTFGATGRASLTWMGDGGTIKAGTYQIHDPCTYVSNGTPSQEEASCINVRLPIGKPVPEERGALGY